MALSAARSRQYKTSRPKNLSKYRSKLQANSAWPSHFYWVIIYWLKKYLIKYSSSKMSIPALTLVYWHISLEDEIRRRNVSRITKYSYFVSVISPNAANPLMHYKRVPSSIFTESICFMPANLLATAKKIRAKQYKRTTHPYIYVVTQIIFSSRLCEILLFLCLWCRAQLSPLYSLIRASWWNRAIITRSYQ
jgi:hypothetical protein